jgi:hypothetical protein
MDVPLMLMPSKEVPPVEVPKTGTAIKELNSTHLILRVDTPETDWLVAQGVQALLDFFDIPFVSTMFLHDKKLLYLNFLGASGSLKHLVLD